MKNIAIITGASSGIGKEFLLNIGYEPSDEINKYIKIANELFFL